MPDKRESHRGVLVKTSPDDASAELERLISKQKYKDAVKQAKLIHKAKPTLQSHRQLESAYFLRAEQLYRLGMVSSAAEVAQHLLDFGLTDPKLLENLPPFLLKVGLGKEAFRIQGQGNTDSAPGQSRLVLLAADQAVLHPERSQPHSPEVGQEAALVRQAFEALQASNEALALGLLRDIARSSPLSEWKLLVRGLAAFYRRDSDEMQANWSRLDPERAPIRIARQLQRLRESQSAQDDGPAREKLEHLVFGESILPRLRELSDLVSEERWPEVIRRITALRISLDGVDPRLAERLTSVLLGPLLERAACLNCKSGTPLLREFIRVAHPLDIDPAWNRLWALAWEHSCDGGTMSTKFWEKYSADLETCNALRSEDRPLAQALVWKHMAELTINELDDLLEDDDDDFEFFRGFEDDDDDEPVTPDEERLARQAMTYIERSLQLAPGHRPTYDLLLALSRRTKDQGRLAEAKRRVLEVFPDDIDVLVETAKELHRRGEPERALEVVSRARKVKPLDEFLCGFEIMVRTALARELAIQKRWDEGRAQFEAIEQLRPDEQGRFYYLARKATFETKAGQSKTADQYEQAAAALLPEPAPLWLALHIEAVRFKLTKATQKHYEGLLKNELKRKCRSETAGAMASLLSAYIAVEVKFESRDRIATEVLKYLRRTTRLNYRLEDLQEVIEFLGEFDEDTALVRKLVERGLRTQRDSVVLHLAAAKFGPRGPASIGHATFARHHLQTALKLAEASTRRDETRLVPEIKRMLSVLDEAHSRLAPLPFGPPGSRPGSINDFLDGFRGFLESLPDEEEEDDDDDSTPSFRSGFFGSGRSRRASGGNRRRRS